MTTTTTDGLTRWTIDELRARRGFLAQGLQGALLEGLAIDGDDAAEMAAVDAELRRRESGGS